MFDKRNLGKWAGVREEAMPVEQKQENVATPTQVKAPAPTPEKARGLATIGPSITIKGDLSGEEDLIIQGQVEGTIHLKQNSLIIGQEGRINANVLARVITVEGTVKGDLYGDEKIVIKKSANIMGNASAPRVSLEDGAIFKGSIDMDRKRADSSEKRTEQATASVAKLEMPVYSDKPKQEMKVAPK